MSHESGHSSKDATLPQFNVLTSGMFPVRYRDRAERQWVSFIELFDPDVIDFAADRPDFQGSYALLAISILHLLYPELTITMWQNRLSQPLDQAELASRLQPWLPCFELFGQPYAFMQDAQLIADAQKDPASANDIDGLLLESAGGITVKQNKDLFIKRRDSGTAVSLPVAAIMLFNLNSNAPSGGAGYRTSLRGGGPLNTLIALEQPDVSLGQRLWVNVLTRDDWNQVSAPQADIQTLPWLGDMTQLQIRPDGQVVQHDVQPVHRLFAQSQRLALLPPAADSGGICDISGEKAAWRVSHYLARPYGLNYKGRWTHPFSPYYGEKGKPDSFLPLHPQPGGFSWRFWLGWVMGQDDGKKQIEPATIVNARLTTRQIPEAWQPVIWAFGFDMDNAKARCYYESRMPTHHVEDLLALGAQQQPVGRRGIRRDPAFNFRQRVDALIRSAELILKNGLIPAVKRAYFGDSDSRGDLSFIDTLFWAQTDSLFHQTVEQIRRDELRRLRDDTDSDKQVEQKWVKELYELVNRLFGRELVAFDTRQTNFKHYTAAHHILNAHKLRQALETITS